MTHQGSDPSQPGTTEAAEPPEPPEPPDDRPKPNGAWRRRQLLRGGVAAAVVGAGAGIAALAQSGAAAGKVPGADVAARFTGGCLHGPTPDGGEPGPLVRGGFDSPRRGRRVGYAIAYPPGATQGDPLRVCLLLHGRGGDHATNFDDLRYHRHLTETGASMALASVDGGPDSYWHLRRDGDDPLGMVVEEFLPRLAQRHGLDTGGPVGALGWSMGGYGALLLAEGVPDRVVAVVASAPAVSTSYAASRPGAFDSAEDWAAHDVIGHADRLRSVKVRVDCGSGDPFAAAVRALARRLPADAQVNLSRGCHDSNFWQRHARDQLRFVADALGVTTGLP